MKHLLTAMEETTMTRKNISRKSTHKLAQVCLLLTLLSVYSIGAYTVMIKVQANPSVSSEWYYPDWQYRKEHNLTRSQVSDARFYNTSVHWTTIAGNPTGRHAFQPVHNTTIVEVNKYVEGSTRKFLAYDSDAEGTEIWLYFTNDTGGTWAAYSGNPILESSALRYRWPSVAYINDTFHMFLTDRTDGTLERWTSTDGIHFTYRENVKTGGNEWKNPFIWFNTNDEKWYLYSHDTSSSGENIKVRSATNIEDLDTATDTIVVSRTNPFGSPTMMYQNGIYWLLGEALQGSMWKAVAYYSTTSPSSGFKECLNSPILSNDECCPMLFLDQDHNRSYLFTTRDSTRWYQDTREVYLNSTVFVAPPDLTDYQIRITTQYIGGTDNGENVHLNSHSRTDFGDVRFTWYNNTSHSETECDYWIEDLKAGNNATFWIKIPRIASNTNVTMYLYYGKVDATTTSNGNATLDFSDDFSGTLAKWTTVGGTWQIENGELSAQTNAFGQRIRANNFAFTNHSIQVRAKWISGTYFEHGPFARGQQLSEQSNGYMTYLSAWPYDNRHRISKMSSGSESTVAGQGTTNPSKDVWYTFTFKLCGNTLKSSISQQYSTEISGTDNTFTSGTLCLFSWPGTSEHVHYDNLFVRKYQTPEPTHSDWGYEESGESVAIDQSFISDVRADVGSVQTIGLHAKWSNNNSDIINGSIYVNGTAYATNDTGWISFTAFSSTIGTDRWVTTGVNCNDVTTFTQTAPTPSVIWDQLRITEGDITNDAIPLGQTTIIWFNAVYSYNNDVFDAADGILYMNGSATAWSTANNRWEYEYEADTAGRKTFAVSGVQDAMYNLTTTDDTVGILTLETWYSPFSVASNSTISELTFNSTIMELSFKASGPSETMGYTNLTIAKTLVENASELKVYLDGNEINYTTTETAYYWSVYFTYTHSTHTVAVRLGSTRSGSFTRTPFESIALFGAVLTTVLIAISIVAYPRKRSNVNGHSQRHGSAERSTSALENP